MNVAEITKLSTREKFELMEALWEDMRSKAEESDIPQEHLDLVQERWARVQSGESVLLDWDEVKDSIGKP
jgi:putative addiction module component (TIGR02574 family)